MNLKFIKIFFIFALVATPFIFVQAGTAPIKILIVPGHDNKYSGTEYNGLKEADMNLALATQIFDILKKDKRFEVHITRDESGYTKEFADFFVNHKDEIIAFKQAAKTATKEKIASGSFVKVKSVPHNSVNADIALTLYGINKWANDNSMDLVFHIHFDDFPNRNKKNQSKYRGYVVYLPEDQMANAPESAKVAKSVFDQLHTKYVPSNYSKESGGFIKDQGLIALGTNGTLDASVRSVLVEYGYIYRFGDYKFRQSSYKTMSSLTAKGIENYFKK